MPRLSFRILCVCAGLFSLLTWGCQQERQPCLEPKNQSAIMGAYHAGDTNNVITISPVILSSPVIRAISATGAGVIYYGSAAQAHSFSFLLSTLSDSCQYAIARDTISAATDTISFYYDRQLHFLSNACGYTYFFTIQNVTTTHHNIDSVILENNSVTTNVNVEHLKVYFMEL